MLIKGDLIYIKVLFLSILMKWINDSWQLKQIYSSKYISWFNTTASVEQLVAILEARAEILTKISLDFW